MIHRINAMPRIRIGLCAVCALLLSLSAPWVTANEEPQRRAERPWVFGVVPQQSALKLVRQWGPLLEAVASRAGIRLQFATAPDIPTFEQRVRDGHYDFAYMNPYHYTVFSSDVGFQPLVKARDKRLRGILVVHRDSPLARLSELKPLGELAFPAPAAFAATLLTRAELDRLAVVYRPAYVGSHDAVYRGVASGRFEMGGGIERTLNALEPAVRDQLRILWRSADYTAHAIAAHPRVDGGVTAALQRTLIALGNDPVGRALLDPLRLSGFERAEDADWDDVRGLSIPEMHAASGVASVQTRTGGESRGRLNGFVNNLE